MIVSIIIWSIGLILFGLNLLREIYVYRDIKSNFYCTHCGTFHMEVSRIDKCSKCHRTFKIKGNSWDHLILHRVNWIPTNSKSGVFKWKDYKKLSIIEITINIFAISILAICIAITVI